MMLVDEAPPRLARRPGRRLSEVLRDLQAGDGARIAVGDIVGALRDRSFAPLMVIFAAPNVFLFIPGSSMFTALPLMVLGLQLILGRPDVWLPRFVALRSIERASFDRIVTASVPYSRSARTDRATARQLHELVYRGLLALERRHDSARKKVTPAL